MEERWIRYGYPLMAVLVLLLTLGIAGTASSLWQWAVVFVLFLSFMVPMAMKARHEQDYYDRWAREITDDREDR